MKQKILNLSMALVCMMTGVCSASAIDYKGGELVDGNKYCLQNVNYKSFISGEGNTTSLSADDAIVFTLRISSKEGTYLFTEDDGNHVLDPNQKGLSDLPTLIAGIGGKLSIDLRSQNNDDYLYYVKNNLRLIFGSPTAKYLGENGSREINCAEKKDNNDSYTWRLIPATEAKLAINSSAQYGTFVAPFNVTLPDGVKAYTVASATASATTDGLVTFSEVDGNTISAGTPIVVYKEDGFVETSLYGLHTITESIVGDGMLKGVLTDGQTAPKDSYVINYIDGKVGFYIVGDDNSINVGKNRCYLEPNAGSAAKLNFMFEDANAISSTNDNVTISAIFSVTGDKLCKMQKGMNVVKYSDGSVKKILIK